MAVLLSDFTLMAKHTAERARRDSFEVQGHRGCRGIQPENTVSAFIEAVKAGVQVLELDVVVSADSQIVVSHEPWMSWEFCRTPDGHDILPGEDSTRYNIYKMPYQEIRRYDCGSKPHPRFPGQERKKAYKPLLNEVIDRVEQFVQWNKFKAVYYNIEIKSTPFGDGSFHPEPGRFVQLVYNLLKKKNMLKRIYIQSFDIRILQELHRTDPSVKICLLVDNSIPMEQQLMKLGFKPSIYSPDFHFVNASMIEKLHRDQIRVIPWTVNNENDMLSVFKMGADGLITDFPDRAMQIIVQDSFQFDVNR